MSLHQQERLVAEPLQGRHNAELGMTVDNILYALIGRGTTVLVEARCVVTLLELSWYSSSRHIYFSAL